MQANCQQSNVKKQGGQKKFIFWKVIQRENGREQKFLPFHKEYWN